MTKRLPIAFLATAALLAPFCMAQRGPGMGFHGARIGAGTVQRPYPSAVWLGAPYFYADYSSPVLEPAGPQVVVVQAPPANTGNNSPVQPAPDPLLIEWQGDRYVRFGGESASSRGKASNQPDYAGPIESRVATGSGPAAEPALTPAVLVYRDGHREDVSEYTIVDAVIYARGNPWQNGYWTKNVPLTAINVPLTISANRERGVNFILPTGPNVVVTRF